MKDWIEIRAEFDRPPEDWSVYADAFDRHGCPGSIQTDEPPAISAYLAAVGGAPAVVEELSAELRRLGVERVSTAVVPEQDWSELWKIHFKPRRIGERFVIRPTWEAFDSEPEDLVIVLDPGQAFGTGDHPTTRLCLRLMERAALEGKSVADIGCGSGVLSIGACYLGAASVLASDIDPLSVEITRENMALNGVSFETVAGDGFAVLQEPVDVVLSNIISATLIRLAPEAAAAVKSRGLWIVSGIIESNWPDVLRAAERVGFELVEMEREDEWVGATLRRRV